MTKNELIAKMASAGGISKIAATKALTALLDGIKTSLKKGQRVPLIGFGTFSVAKRKARTGRNPRTGQEIKIPATRVPKFSAGKVLKGYVK